MNDIITTCHHHRRRCCGCCSLRQETSAFNPNYVSPESTLSPAGARRGGGSRRRKRKAPASKVYYANCFRNDPCIVGSPINSPDERLTGRVSSREEEERMNVKDRFNIFVPDEWNRSKTRQYVSQCSFLHQSHLSLIDVLSPSPHQCQ